MALLLVLLLGADAPTIVVRIDNDAGVRHADLQFAESRAASVFAKIGVRVTWVDAADAVANRIQPPLTLVIVNASAQRGTALFADALGIAQPSVRRAHVFYDRVLQTQALRPTPMVLGDVMAHELGHLMLLSHKHSREGIMKPAIEQRLLAIASFTSSEAQEIAARIRTLPD
jgi:hypothetical protein